MYELIRSFWRLLERRERVKVLLALAVLLVSSLVQMLGVGSILPLMAVLSTPQIIQSNHWLHALYSLLHFTSEAHFLFFLGLCSLGAVLLSNAFLALNQWITVHLSASIQQRFEVRLLETYLQAPYVVHLRRSAAELKRNVLDETLRLSGIANLGLQLVASGFLILCITVLLLAVSPILSVLLGVLIGGGYGLVYLVVRRRMARIGRERMDANLQRYKMVDEGLGGLKELRLLQRTSWTMRRYKKAAGTLTASLAEKSVLDTLPRYFIEVLGFGGMLLVVLYLLASHRDVRATIPLISIFAFGAYRILPAMQSAYNSTVGLGFVAPVALAMEAELRSASEARAFGSNGCEEKTPLPFRSAIDLCKVSFSFTQDRSYALRDVTLTIPYGAFVGFAGETGAGKSTLADVILGLLPPEKGEVRVDGVLLRGGATARWQRLLGYVPQEVYLTDDTIESNIAFGLPPDLIDGSAVREAARLAQVDGFIERELPEGYQTLVGDRGVRLSGGQRQRIGIARALYHHPEVLVLDEATSMLDGETEGRVFSAIEHLSREVTLIVIAHRLTTIQRADTIYLLERGTITAHGTFSELLDSNEQFQKMAQGKVDG
jgi:ABC-type multidrug transport system fused ATPase/permease subunit